MIVGSLHLPIKTFAELIAFAKANPGKLNFASAGIGTAPHLAGELIKLRTGIDMTHVPYRGIGAVVSRRLSGKVQMAFSSIAGAVPFTSDNRVRPIATTGAERSGRLSGRADGRGERACPASTSTCGPASIAPAGHAAGGAGAAQQRDATRRWQHPEMKAALAKIGVEPRGTTPQESAAFTRAEYDKWKKVIVDGKIKPE